MIRLMYRTSLNGMEGLEARLSDNALAEMAAQGDGQAFSSLLERHYDRIFRIALRFCGVREDAEDIAQDVCISLASALRGYRGEAGFTTWLYRIVVNRVRDAQRKASTSERMHRDYGEVETMRRGEQAALDADLAWLQETLEGLGEDLRETAILVIGEGLPHAEAGEILGIGESTVSWRMHKLKGQLKEIAEQQA